MLIIMIWFSYLHPYPKTLHKILKLMLIKDKGGAVARLAERSTTGAGPWVRFPVRPLDLAETEFRQSDLGLDDAEFSESLGSNQLPASPRPPGC